MLIFSAFIASNLPAIQINLAIIHAVYKILNYQLPGDFISFPGFLKEEQFETP